MKTRVHRKLRDLLERARYAYFDAEDASDVASSSGAEDAWTLRGVGNAAARDRGLEPSRRAALVVRHGLNDGADRHVVVQYDHVAMRVHPRLEPAAGAGGAEADFWRGSGATEARAMLQEFFAKRR